MKKNIIILFLLNVTVCFAQNEANNWYFGVHAGITFNNGAPEALTDSAMNTAEGCATISNNLGDLLFYTDGVTVYNANHQIMQNGSDLLGDFSSTQSAIAIPKPNDPDTYYIFTTDKTAEEDGLRYSVVDMSLDGGLGAVTSEKNILLITPVLEKVNAVLHANGQDIWVITHGYGNNEFYAYLVTETGINTTPVVSSVGVFVPDDYYFNAIGVLKASPNGNKLVMCLRDLATQVYNFNNFTGVVSNPVDVHLGIRNYGAEFSPSGNVLYVTHTNIGLMQYDLTVPDIQNSGQFIYQVDPDAIPDEELGQLQLGPDNKIYVSIKNKLYLSAINNPETLGTGCNFDSDAIYLEGKRCIVGLPTFIQSFFYVGFEVENLCEGNETQFMANTTQTYDNIFWDFGDGFTSSDENPTHTFVNSGTYQVSLTVTVGTNSSTETKTISIYENPIVSSPVDLVQCDDNTDGYTYFNLTEANENISVNHLNETITFFETFADAESELNPIVNDSSYENQSIMNDVIWARVENIHGCYDIAQVDLNVTTTQIPDAFSRDLYACDNGADTSDGIATFDFSAVQQDIESLFPLGQLLNISYFQNEMDALSETNPIADITNYENIYAPNQQNIYVRVDSGINNECLGLGHHITLHVESVPIANSVTIDEVCDDDGDGMYAFDTSTIEASILNGQTNVFVEYFDESDNLLSSPLPNPFLTASQTITARVNNSTSQNPNENCYAETELIFTVQDLAVAYPINDFVGCDDDNDGLYSFDVSNLEADILNGQTGMIVTYTDENGNILPSPLPNPFEAANQTIQAKVENPLSVVCYDEVIINFIVAENPIAYPISDDFVCDDISNDEMHTFTLSDYDSEILNGQSQLTFEVVYFDDYNNAINNINALNNTYLVSNQQTVFARIQNRLYPNCFQIEEFVLGINYLPIAYQPNDILVCDDQTNDGFENIDLSVQNAMILNGQSNSENNISYHLSQFDSENNINPVGNNFTNTENPQTIFARIENINNSNCYTTTSFQVIIHNQPVLEMPDQFFICESGSVDIIADEGFDQYLWSTGETSQSITVSTTGDYELTVTHIFNGLSCSTSKTIAVTNSSVAVITEIETIDWSFNNNSIIIFVDGIGNYEYSLDGINYQDDNIFTNLIVDEYTIYVRDKNGCGIKTQDIYLLYYPKFFTPNNDGYHDYWHLYNANREPGNLVYIYDRYGKLLKTLSHLDIGWDGTLNGSKMPSNDYWFRLIRINGKEYTGHFSLKN